MFIQGEVDMTEDKAGRTSGRRLLYRTLGLLFLAGVAYLSFWPVPVDPVAWVPDPDRGMVGAFAASRSFAEAGFEAHAFGPGPEDVAIGADGTLYSGLQDGRIMKLRPGATDAELFADTKGRPLGMQFDAGGHLIVADAFKGLLSVDPAGAVTVLADSVDGQRLMFTDDLDIAADGTIWFSNASQRFGQHSYLLDFWEGGATGQLLSYDPHSGTTRVRLAGLRFANGVALGPDDAFVLVNETMAARITRLWLTGPDAGKRDVFADGLPGLPDNLSFNGRDLFWVAFPATRSAAFDALAPRPGVRKLLLRLPESWVQVVPPPIGWIAGFSLAGQVRYSYRDTSGRYTDVTSVNERDGKLYLGSLKMSSVASLDAEQ
jgi:sugar lactone lactonase YvrE